VVVFALTDRAERFAVGETLFLSPTPDGERGVTPVTIHASRLHQGRRLLKLDRIDDRTHAEQRAGSYLVIPYATADEAREEGEFFLHALVGREVRAEDGRRLGVVVDIMEPKGAALLEIGEAGGARRLLPFIREFVREVGEDAIVVSPPAGWEEL